MTRNVKAWVAKGVELPLEFENSFELNANGSCTEYVEVSHAALNLRDHWIRKGKYPKLLFPIILGSDLSGWYNDNEVIVNPSINWGSDQRFQSKDFRIQGMPDHGSFASGVYVPLDNIFPKPKYLNMAEAAALPLAGLTAFRSCIVKGNPKPGEKVLISGVGGGVALFAMQFAIASGAEVYVTSGSVEKLERAIAMGAKAGVIYSEPNFDKKLLEMSGGIDLVIDSAAGAGFNSLLKTLNPGGRIVIYGATRGAIPDLNPFAIYWKQLSLMGSTMGSPDDFRTMLTFIDQHKIIPVVDTVFEFPHVEKAFERIAIGDQFGKIVVNIQS